MQKDKTDWMPLLPPEPPPSDLFNKVMSAVMLEPAPSWESIPQQNKGRVSLLTNANGLVMSVICASLVAAFLLALWPEALIAPIEESISNAVHYVRATFANIMLIKQMFTRSIFLVPQFVKTAGALYTTGAHLLQIVGTGPLLTVIVLIGAFSVTGQIYLLRLLSKRPDAQPVS